MTDDTSLVASTDGAPDWTSDVPPVAPLRSCFGVNSMSITFRSDPDLGFAVNCSADCDGCCDQCADVAGGLHSGPRLHVTARTDRRVGQGGRNLVTATMVDRALGHRG